MFYQALQALSHVFKIESAKAHCDIPCGIYDPHQAQVAALTVIRMIDLMNDLSTTAKQDNLEYHNSLSRYIMVKEEHAELCKREIRVIWGDYIKQPHLDKYPELPGLVHKIMQLGSKSRQTVSRETAMELLGAVNRFSEIFWETKNIKTKRVKAPYKPEEEVVYPIL
jgi:nickel superoxide dismutase